MKAKAHKRITKKAIEIYTVYSQSDFKDMLKTYGDEVVEGSVEADLFPIFDRMKNWHFYKENDRLESMSSALGPVYPTSDHILSKRITQLEESIVKAEEATSSSEKENELEDAFELVGRALHHVQDMSTPSHITPIYHGPDFPFDQVDDALIIPDHYESFTAKKAVLSSLVDSVSIAKVEFGQLKAEVDGLSLLDVYDSAAQVSLNRLFDDASSNYIEGRVNGNTAPIPFSMFWQKNDPADDDGRIKGFGDFGPLEKMFKKPGKVIKDEAGDSYVVEQDALKVFASGLFNKMVADSLRALFVVEKMMSGTMDLKVETVEPVYGENYDLGYIGFTYQKESVVSKGIAYITRWSRMSDIRASHAFVVSGEDECIEAVGKGVGTQTLSHYFDDPDCQVFFRKPNPYNSAVAKRVCETAKTKVGEEYDTSLIAAQALHGSVLGYMFDKNTGGALERFISNLLNSENQWICSELAAFALDQQDEYRDRGILKDPNETIDPQELFEDETIFKAWRNDGN